MIAGVRRRFRPLFVVVATVMWVMLMGELSVGNLVAGLLVGLIVSIALPLPSLPAEGLTINILPFLGLISRWTLYLFSGSIRVAWLSIRKAEPPRSAIVTVPMRVDSELVLSLATTLYNLQPGGTVTDIDVANRLWTVHILDASSTDKVDAEIAAIEQYEQRLKRAFERNNA
ncbi:Na+/H+ antiporter subunit E [Corynebacterium ulcerans]|uniref:Monovalent cation/H+ antiporter subunit E n=2 Tax=Corynebacterium ulcerans TaxID=65058 RepID=A0ABD0BKT2_CORUL|nr:Na+/H+ antiporter subunit E [Corynebacterium ulcerans]AEG84753.1 multicomponent Na+:H+ antiporter subunit E [Corynebacterium ulcerans BR-AD22]AIT89930.1 Na(+)/H(+) antiporter subunit E [Corynebacterium ulcerans]AKA97430.1 Na(+)/H(+) antiporter subunit E [Corynebacterium ulcerans]AKN77894.1 Na(+)/H(+) antiporter subunit E [Corynebacterium ulcerans FRC58]ALD95725.1 Na(+)/H(+) antiporter subunit E [Corynebacterium ulcerans]